MYQLVEIQLSQEARRLYTQLQLHLVQVETPLNQEVLQLYIQRVLHLIQVLQLKRLELHQKQQVDPQLQLGALVETRQKVEVQQQYM